MSYFDMSINVLASATEWSKLSISLLYSASHIFIQKAWGHEIICNMWPNYYDSTDNVK